jgi:hypothetical protein
MSHSPYIPAQLIPTQRRRWRSNRRDKRQAEVPLSSKALEVGEHLQGFFCYYLVNKLNQRMK